MAHGISDQLLAAHWSRFTGIDPLLPNWVAAADGERLDATTPDGQPVSAMLRRRSYAPGAVELLWSAAQVWQLFPFITTDATREMDTLLRAWTARMRTEQPSDDSACSVVWPSRDAGATKALLDHGFAPLSVLAVRETAAMDTTAPDSIGTDSVSIRPARPDDFDAALALAVTTFKYAARTGAPHRDNPAQLLSAGLWRSISGGSDAVWLVERAGTAIGMAECGWVQASPGSVAAGLLPEGNWGYVNNVVVAPEFRERGAAQALMATVHTAFRNAGAQGTFLYYNPPNPLSSVFWHRQGYRPLWTAWETRPASALR